MSNSQATPRIVSLPLSGASASHLASELIFLCQLPHKDFLSFSVWVWFVLVVVLLSFGFVCVWFSCCVVVVCVWFFWEGRSEDEVQLFNYKLISCVSIVFSPVILPICTSGLESHTVTDCLSARERSESILLFSPV